MPTGNAAIFQFLPEAKTTHRIPPPLKFVTESNNTELE